jgi:anti-anti-sigma factor
MDRLLVVCTRLGACRVLLAVLELSELTLLSTLAMGALVSLRRDLGRWGGRVRLAATPPSIHDALTAAGLTDLFEFYRSVEEALAAA